MKKIKREENLRLRMGPVKLYRDDIDEIVETFKELADKVTFSITVGEYSLSSIDELSELNQTLKETKSFWLSCSVENSSYSRFSLSIAEDETSLTFDPNTPVSRGVFVKLERLLKSRRRRLHWVRANLLYFFALITVGSFTTLNGQVNKVKILEIIGGIFTGVSILMVLLFAVTYPVTKSKIILVSRANEQSFWKRNKDTIIVAIITGAITALLGILGTLLVQSISK